MKNYQTTIKPNQENLLFLIQGHGFWALDYTVKSALKRFKSLCKKKEGLTISIYLVKEGFTQTEVELNIDNFTITYQNEKCILLTQTEI